MTKYETLELIIKTCEFEYKPKKGPFELIDKIEWYKKHVSDIKTLAEEGKKALSRPTIFIPAGSDITKLQYVNMLCTCLSCMQKNGSGGSGPGSLQEP